MTNQTSNETLNNATNQSLWEIKDITDIQSLFTKGQDIVSDLLLSWDMLPEDVYFRLLIVLLGALVLYQLFVSGSSKAGGGFKYVLMTILVIVVLIALNII